MPTEAQRRANRKQDQTRDRVAVWLTAADGARLDQIAAHIGSESRAKTVRRALDALAAKIKGEG